MSEPCSHLCPVCGHERRLVCYACKGKAGGSKRTGKKLRASTVNLALARQAKRRPP